MKNDRVKALYKLLHPCRLCPHNCGIDRLNNEQGKCKTGNEIFVSSFNVHHGEEPPISGTKGSGTIFFANCNLSCVFCQNYPISQHGNGIKFTIEKLTEAMLDLQSRGVHNINFVTPTHVVPFVIEAYLKAKEKGLKLPLVYNCGGYESVETLQLLDGIVDIYLPDAKYSDNSSSSKYSGVNNYWEFNQKALKEMYRQVGNLKMDKAGIASKGLIVRHLVLPGNISGTKKVLQFISKELSKEVYVSLMAQYHPAHRSESFTEINRHLSQKEYFFALKTLEKMGLENGWRQELCK